tara:strand:- start:3566 stop:4867 length:1302 start_codon:yes stop_codon:yes gene_type:complete
MDVIFSVVIPIYNSEKFLTSTIKSVIQQKNKKTEIILVNDFSIDKSKKICLDFKKKFNFVKLINNKKNFGVGYSRNVAIKNSTGKYIVFLDSDDALCKNALNKLEKFIIKNSYPDLIPVRFKKITFPQNNDLFLKDNYKKSELKTLIRYVLNKDIPFSDCWFFVISRKLLKNKKIIFPNSRFGESEIFVAKTICYAKNYKCFRHNFYHKKDRGNSLTHSNDFETTYSTLINLIQFNDFYNKDNFTKLQKKFLNRYIQGIFGVFTALLILRNNIQLKKISNLLKKNPKNLDNLVKLPEKINLRNLINKKGSYHGLLAFISSIKKDKLNRLKKINLKKSKIFAYCRSQYSAATINILQEKKYQISGIVDDNKNFKKSKFLKFKTMSSNDLFKEYRINEKNTVVIITHQKTNTSKKITNFLINNKINKNKIFTIKF